MKQIYLIDEHMSSKQNGVGTYVRHFVQMFDDADCQVNILSFNPHCRYISSFTLKIRRFFFLS